MRKTLIKFIVISISIIAALFSFEILLRLNPALIGYSVRERLHPDLRAEISAKIGKNKSANRRLITSEERADGGPPIRLSKPNINRVKKPPADAAYGAVSYEQTDSLGFCNPPDLIGQSPMDIVTLAGSVPNCVRVMPEQTFTAQLGNLTGLKSYNLAMIGIGPYEYNEILRRFGPDLRPRVVIMIIGEGNDIRDCLRYLGFQETSRNRLGGPFALSYALAFLKGGVEAISAKPLERLAAFYRRKAAPNFRYTVTVQGQPVRMNGRNGDRDELETANLLMAGKASPQLYEAPLMTFAKLAREMNFTPLVVLVPAAYTIYDQSIVFEDDRNAAPMRNYSASQRNWLASNAERIGVEFLDATPHMREATQTRPLLYFPINLHLTAEGHAALAEVVAPEAKKLLAGKSAAN